MQQTTEAALAPEWLYRWLNLSFYEGTCMCAIHSKKFNTVYCASCRHHPVCLTCWKLVSHLHAGDHHHVLEVLRASRRVAIDARKIRKYLDVSEIQMYSINGNDIVFLNPNQEAAAPHDDVRPNCRTCRRRLIKDQEKFGYHFCSIACKYPREEDGGHLKKRKKSETKEDGDHLKKRKRSQIKEEKRIKVKLMIKRNLIRINDESRPASFRQKSRKGIPYRAPLK